MRFNIVPPPGTPGIHTIAREIVALGGPNAKDHPDLFKLVQERQTFNPSKSNRTGTTQGTGPSESTGEGVNAMRGKRQQTAAEESSPVVGEEQERMSDQGGEAELTIEKCPW